MIERFTCIDEGATSLAVLSKEQKKALDAFVSDRDVFVRI